MQATINFSILGPNQIHILLNIPFLNTLYPCFSFKVKDQFHTQAKLQVHFHIFDRQDRIILCKFVCLFVSSIFHVRMFMKYTLMFHGCYVS